MIFTDAELASPEFPSILAQYDIQEYKNYFGNDIVAAVHNNRPEAVRAFLPYYSKGNTNVFWAFIEAIVQEHVACVREFATYPDLDINNELNSDIKMTPLGRAIQEKKWNVIPILLQHPDININKSYQCSYSYNQLEPIQGAILSNDPRVVEGVISAKGIKPFPIETGQSDLSPLALAASRLTLHANGPTIFYLIYNSQQFNVGAQSPRCLSTACIEAAKTKHLEIVSLLAHHPDTNINAQNQYGYSALHNAINSGDEPCIAAILSVPNIQIDVPNNQGETPIHFAAKMHLSHIVRTLIQRGANINHVSKDGLTPLHAAVRNAGNHEADCVKVIDVLASAAGLHLEHTYKGDTCMHVAARLGYHQVLVKLAALGANVNALNDYGQTPLMCASNWGLFEAVHTLLLNGATVTINTQDTLNKETALHKVCKVFLASVGAAGGASNLATIVDLIRAGSDLTIRNGAGMTALDLMPENYHAYLKSLTLDQQLMFSKSLFDSVARKVSQPEAALEVVADAMQIDTVPATVPKRLSFFSDEQLRLQQLSNNCIDDMRKIMASLQENILQMGELPKVNAFITMFAQFFPSYFNDPRAEDLADKLWAFAAENGDEEARRLTNAKYGQYVASEAEVEEPDVFTGTRFTT